jgi:hypothetical protein
MDYLKSTTALGCICLLLLSSSCTLNAGEQKGSVNNKTILLSTLKDKIKGGWAGQTIGVTFGGPTEFRNNGTFIQDYQSLTWYDGYLKNTMEHSPGLYDDIYMDLTFVDILNRMGLDAPVDSFANAFAHAKYPLWHANQAARYNILNGVKAPETGNWARNPHADDIDFQIEADFSGLMNPGMPNSASKISDKIGHIMNYGDGWYGGVYVGAMYTLAFVSDDVNYVVNEALKTIPEESEYYQCISDVIKWHKQYPNDWNQTWFEIQKKWSSEVGCPDGVFAPFDIDAKVNSAYIVLGLLYGMGDYTKTLEIATRAGQDSDCNPSSVAGILGTIIGYDKIPTYWKMGLKDIENMNFVYTNMSLNNVYDISYKHALQMIKLNGGKVGATEATIAVQAPERVRFEKSFDKIFPVAKVPINQDVTSSYSFEFDGTGVVLRGSADKANKRDDNLPEYIFNADVFIDGKKAEVIKLTTESQDRKLEIFWNYQLAKGHHTVKIVVNNPNEKYKLRAWEYLVYSDKLVDGAKLHRASY